MRTSRTLALASAIIFALLVIPASAAPLSRTFVSGTGSDSNTCIRTAPCASFGGALGKTATGGEIDCLDPGDFGAVTINKSVSIICDGVSNGGIALSSLGNAISVDASTSSVVYLSGLDLNGGGAGNFGIIVNSPSAAVTVYIVHCTIRGFANDGGVGVESPETARVIIKDSTIVNNGDGVLVQDQGAANALLIFNTIIDGNANYAAYVNGSHSYIALQQTVLSGSPDGLNVMNGGSAELIGPSNTIAGTIVGSPTSVAFK